MSLSWVTVYNLGKCYHWKNSAKCTGDFHILFLTTIGESIIISNFSIKKIARFVGEGILHYQDVYFTLKLLNSNNMH